MTGISGPYGYNGSHAMLTQSVSQLSTMQQALEGQAASGMLADNFADLGNSRSQVLSLEPALSQISTWSGNITQAQTTLDVTQSALGQIGSLASSLSQSIATLGGTPSADTVQVAATQAKQALQSLGGLLNTRSGDSYIFAGSALQTPPITDPATLASGTLATSIGQTLKTLPTQGAANVLSQTLDLAASTTADAPFAATLSVTPTAAAQLAPSPSIGQDSALSIGIVATQGTAPSASSTGSPIRDLMRNLMIVANLPGQATNTSSYAALIQGLTTSASTTSSGITGLQTSTGITQNTLTSQSTMLQHMQTSLTTQLGQARNADLAAVSSQMSAIQDNLQASYSIIADMKGMTLANYI